MNQSHDLSYKLLFSEPEIIIDLLQGFVHEPWVKELDFTTLEKVAGFMFQMIYAVEKMMSSGGFGTNRAGFTCIY